VRPRLMTSRKTQSGSDLPDARSAKQRSSSARSTKPHLIGHCDA
jgi:hypothetical protein